MTSHEKEVIKNLIKKDKIEQAFEEPLLKALDKTDKKDIELLEFRLSSANRKKSNGTINNEEYIVEKNQIVKSLLDLLEEIDLEDSNFFLKLLKKHKTLIGLGFVILFSLSFYLFFVDESIIENVKPILNIPKADKQLTVFVIDVKGNVVLKNEGELNIPLGNRLLNEPIGNNGRTNFGDITASNIGDTITIGLKAEDWEIVGTNKFVFIGEPIKLIVKRDDSFGLIKGIVQSTNGQSIEDAKIMINVDTTIFTKQDGLFNILLPEKWRAKNKTDLYTFRISKEGFVNLEDERQADSSRNLVFVLEEKKIKPTPIPKSASKSCKPKTCNTNPCNRGIFKFNSETCECELIEKQINGCTDSNAANYNPKANCNDGICKYVYYEVELQVNSKQSSSSIYVDDKPAVLLKDLLLFKKIRIKAKNNDEEHKIELINDTETCTVYRLVQNDAKININSFKCI